MSDNVNRWAGFSDEELRALRAGAVELLKVRSMSTHSRDLANKVASELLGEMTRREGEKPSYCGPGHYRHHMGATYEVLGKTLTGAEYEQVILRRPTHEPGQLFAEMLADFEDTSSGQRRYTYLGPLEDAQMTAPVEIKVVDASHGWATLEGIDGIRHQLAVGDSITVQTLVFS